MLPINTIIRISNSFCANSKDINQDCYNNRGMLYFFFMKMIIFRRYERKKDFYNNNNNINFHK